MSEKWGHSMPHDAFLSIEARKSQSIGARKRTPRAPRIKWSVTLRALVRWVSRFSGGMTGIAGVASSTVVTVSSTISLTAASQ